MPMKPVVLHQFAPTIDGGSHVARHRTRRWVVGALTLASAGVATGCSTTSNVEIQSAQVPAVQPVDGGEGQNQAEVIEAGAIELDDTPIDQAASTSTSTSSPSTVNSTSTTEVAVADADDELSPQGEAMIRELCKTDRHALNVAVDAYRQDFGTAPTSEAELVAMAYLLHRSDVYDVWVDGSIVPQGATCAKKP
jgi:hypothetical protein